jgi:hypothetical protein
MSASVYSVISTIRNKGGVYAPAERADALPLFLLYSYMYSVFSLMERGGAGSKIAHVGKKMFYVSWGYSIKGEHFGCIVHCTQCTVTKGVDGAPV